MLLFDKLSKTQSNRHLVRSSLWAKHFQQKNLSIYQGHPITIVDMDANAIHAITESTNFSTPFIKKGKVVTYSIDDALAQNLITKNAYYNYKQDNILTLKLINGNFIAEDPDYIPQLNEDTTKQQPQVILKLPAHAKLKEVPDNVLHYGSCESLKERIEAVVTQFEQNCITDKHNTVIIYDELTKISRAYGLEEVKLSKILHSEGLQQRMQETGCDNKNPI